MLKVMCIFFSMANLQTFDRSHKAVREFSSFFLPFVHTFFKKKRGKSCPEVPQYRTDGKMFPLIFFSGFRSFLAVV